jgi:phosphoglycerol transferase MdoB-like AlkP superfamily enzyme
MVAKRGKKSVSKKKVETKKKEIKKFTKPQPVKQESLNSVDKKLKFMIRKTALSLILFILSFILLNLSVKEIYFNFFYLSSIILGFLTIALIIVVLILQFLKLMKKI